MKFTTIDMGTGSVIEHLAHRRYDGSFEVINRHESAAFGLMGVSLLQACQKINKEASQVLYGENCFVFDTRVHAAYPYKIYASWRNTLKPPPQDRHLIPGFPKKNNKWPRPQQINSQVDNLFQKNTDQPNFLHYDPLSRFLKEAGRRNASLMTQVKVQGPFRTEGRVWNDKTFKPDPSVAYIPNDRKRCALRFSVSLWI